jgi:transposase
VPMVAEVVDAVVGVDTHRDFHVAEIALPTAAPIAVARFDNTRAGFVKFLAWLGEHVPGPRVAVSIEGARSFGVGLARAVAAAGFAVLESEQPNRSTRRGKGKSDPIDAHLAVLAALRLDAARLPTPRADGDREALRILLGARQQLITINTAQTNHLRALLLTADTDTDRDLARASLTTTTLTRLASGPDPSDPSDPGSPGGPSGPGDPGGPVSRERAIREEEIARLAGDILTARRRLGANEKHLREIVDDIAPGLTDRHGVGPVTAAQVVVSFSHPGRCRNDAAFAALAGTSPLNASSGRITRHRLNRGGDRALNRALHTIALTRMRSCPRTRAYVERRRAEQKTDREIRRCLKRYITRELYRALTTTMTNTVTGPALAA